MTDNLQQQNIPNSPFGDYTTLTLKGMLHAHRKVLSAINSVTYDAVSFDEYIETAEEAYEFLLWNHYADPYLDTTLRQQADALQELETLIHFELERTQELIPDTNDLPLIEEEQGVTALAALKNQYNNGWIPPPLVATSSNTLNGLTNNPSMNPRTMYDATPGPSGLNQSYDESNNMSYSRE